MQEISLLGCYRTVKSVKKYFRTFRLICLTDTSDMGLLHMLASKQTFCDYLFRFLHTIC